MTNLPADYKAAAVTLRKAIRRHRDRRVALRQSMNRTEKEINEVKIDAQRAIRLCNRNAYCVLDMILGQADIEPLPARKVASWLTAHSKPRQSYPQYWPKGS